MESVGTAYPFKRVLALCIAAVAKCTERACWDLKKRLQTLQRIGSPVSSIKFTRPVYGDPVEAMCPLAPNAASHLHML